MPTSADTHDDVVRSEGLMSQGMSRRAALAKIGVGGAVLWASPMLSNVALAGPTSCHPVQLNWDSYNLGSTFTSATFLGNTISFAAASFTGTSALAGNRTVVAGPQGAIVGNFYRLNQNAVSNGYQTLTMNFSYPVYNVSFTITDIDNLNNNWSDRVGFTPGPSSFTIPPNNPASTRVIGGGTLGNPFYNAAANTNLLNNSNRGNVTVSWAGPISSIALRFWCAGEDGSNQLINIGDINFCV